MSENAPRMLLPGLSLWAFLVLGGAVPSSGASKIWSPDGTETGAEIKIPDGIVVPEGMQIGVHDVSDFCGKLSVFPGTHGISLDSLSPEMRAKVEQELSDIEAMRAKGVPSPAELIKQVKQRTRDAWDEGASIVCRGGSLVVIQTPEVHERVAAIIDEIRMDPTSIGKASTRQSGAAEAPAVSPPPAPGIAPVFLVAPAGVALAALLAFVLFKKRAG